MNLSLPGLGRPRGRSIATVCLSGALQEKLETAAAVGFDSVEIFEADLLAYEGSPADIREIATGLGLGISIFQPFRDFESAPDALRARNLDRAERKFDVMEQLGTDLVLVCSNVQPSAIGDDARAAADLRAMAERAARRGLRVGFEALAWGRHISRWGHAWRIVQMADHPALGLIVDSFHTLSLDDDPSGIAEVPAEKLFFVQLADAPRLSMDVLSWSRHHRVFPGQGALDVTGFLRAVLASGYAGPLSLEVFNDQFRAAPSRLTARDGLRSLILAEAEAGAPGGPTALPAPPRFDGFEFLEFAVDEEAGARLGAFLEALGFRLAGRHRSKEVTLYRQGRVNLVLNAEPDSAAAEYFHFHGPSVCAMALRVDDAGRVLERARALLCPEWQEPTGPGERGLPAVRAPDGTLIHLVDPAAAGQWALDFESVESGAVAGLDGDALLGVDHVAQALQPGRMDAFVLFHRAVFGLEAQAALDLPDPFGLVRSQAMVSADRSVRFPLNISDSRETATGKFVSAYAGAGVHHMAFATADLAGLLQRLGELGAAMVPIPANYYDDLAARWGLEEALLARLQRLEMLYDEDANGRFLHAYTQAFGDRFFFEFVERQGGYDGFGAANAGVRLAAQAHLPRGG